MGKEIISDMEGISLVILFIIGSTLVLVPGMEAKADVWIAIILGIFFALLILFIYGRILSLFPGKDLFDILQLVFGSLMGKIIGLLYVWFSFHLGALVLRNFGEFINTVALLETPKNVPMICLSILCIWGVKEGIEVLGRWAQIFCKIVIFFFCITILLMLQDMEINNIRPILYDGMKPVIKGTFSIFSFPFAETVIFMMVFSSLKRKDSIMKVYMGGLFIGGAIVFIAALSDILVLGASAAARMYFPAYATVSRINVGNFIQRIEIIVAITFVIGGFIKISICLLAASNGIAKIFGYEDFRFIVTPTALLMINLSFFIYDNIMEMADWASKTWPYYAFPFQVVIPIIILIGGEIKVRKKRTINKTG